MKHSTFFLFLFLTALLSVSCNKASSKKTSGATSNAYCAQYPTAPGCGNNTNAICITNPTSYGRPGYQGGAGGGGTASCAPPQATQQTVCANYCQYFPGTSGCVGMVNCKTTANYPGCPSPVPSASPTYGALYPQYPNGAVPEGSCSAPTVPANNSFAYDTWKALMTVVGAGRTTSSSYDPMRGIYNPELGSNFYINTDPQLTNVSDAKNFFQTDSTLKVRFKVKPQPTTAGTVGCYNRYSGNGASVAGYTQLKFNVSIKGIKPDGSHTGPIPVSSVNPVGLNSCTPAINLANYKLQYPDGIFIIVDSVQSNQDCSFDQTEIRANGFKNCGSYAPVRSADCWTLEMEVATDTTKTFN